MCILDKVFTENYMLVFILQKPFSVNFKLIFSLFCNLLYYFIFNLKGNSLSRYLFYFFSLFKYVTHYLALKKLP